MFNTLDELAASSLSIEEMIKNLPILIVSNNHQARDQLDILFQKKGFKRILAAQNTKGLVEHIIKKGIKETLRICILDLDINEKYFLKNDFNNLSGLDAELFWKNCIKDRLMTIIGEIGVPISYDKFLDRIKKFGTVDNNLAHNMRKVDDQAKCLDTMFLLSLLQKREVLSDDIKAFYILNETDDPQFLKLQKNIVECKVSHFKEPIDINSIYDEVYEACENLIKKIQNPDLSEGMEGSNTLSEERKKELMTTFQLINALIDSRAENIGKKYNDKLDYDEIEKTKKQIYKIMFHYAVKNELQYFQYFVRGIKGILTNIAGELKFSDIRQCFLFKNILKEINDHNYEFINDDVKQCGLITLLIINNFLFQEKKGVTTVKDFDPMLFYRALGIIFLWPHHYAKDFIDILSKTPNYVEFFLNKTNQTKNISTQHYQNIHRRFLSFTEKVMHVDMCSLKE